MRPRISLSLKISLLACLNILLLASIVTVLMRVQFRMDLGSFLLAPMRDRILSTSRLIALQLPGTNSSHWNQLLAQYSAACPAEFYLFSSEGAQLAGKPVRLPQQIVEVMRRDRGRFQDDRPHGQPPPHPTRFDRPPAPPRLIETSNPTECWVSVHIPILPSGPGSPISGNLVWRFSSLWSNSFFFNYKPWLGVIVAMILVLAICWVPLIRSLTKTIKQLTQTAGQIAEGHFDIELSSTRRDELGQLSEAINRMAERLSGFVQGQRRFLSDVAHELCSPIARMQVALGILEQRAQGNQKEYVADVQAEVQHMSGLINELLSFSKSQMNAVQIELTAVNVADTVRRVIERKAPNPAMIETQIDSRIDVMAEPEYLFRSLANLVRNAIRYAGDAGPITLSAAHAERGAVIITVADSGRGLPEAELEEVFKPFYRPELARQRERGGTGLGLAIVRSCIESCGGSVICRNRASRGLEVEIRLPSPSAGPAAERDPAQTGASALRAIELHIGTKSNHI